MTSLEKGLHSYPTGPRLRCMAVLGSCFALIVGCKSSPPDSFTFTADLPPGFVYQAIAKYEPDIGETCTVPDGRNTAVGYNLKWREHYEPVSEIAIRRTVRGCPLVIRKIDLEIYFAYGKDRGDFASDYAAVAIRGELEEKLQRHLSTKPVKATFTASVSGCSAPSGKPRILRKLLDCKKTDELGALARGRPFAAYTLDQLPGKTVRMKINLAAEERPASGRHLGQSTQRLEALHGRKLRRPGCLTATVITPISAPSKWSMAASAPSIPAARNKECST